MLDVEKRGRVRFGEIGVTAIGFKETPMIAGYQRNVSEGGCSCISYGYA